MQNRSLPFEKTKLGKLCPTLLDCVEEYFVSTEMIFGLLITLQMERHISAWKNTLTKILYRSFMGSTQPIKFYSRVL